MYLITPISVLASIALTLGIIIMLADKFLADYGECKLVINGERELVVSGGSNILSYLNANKIFVPAACGGKATCGLCKGQVDTDVGPHLPTERSFMSKDEIARNVRLLCQIKVKKDMAITIPEEYFLVKEFKAKVQEIQPLTHDTRLFSFSLLEPEEIKFKPGQFVQFRIPGAGEERAYSIASNPIEANKIDLIVRQVPGGLCTTYMFNKLKEGDEVCLTGPYGDFWLREDTDDPLVCVGGGSGSAPIRSIIYYLFATRSKRKVMSFYGGRTPQDIYFTEEYKQLASEMHDFIHIPAVSMPSEEEWDGAKGLITEPMDAYLEDVKDWEAYMCGPPAMLNACTKLLEKKGIDRQRVYFDEF